MVSRRQYSPVLCLKGICKIYSNGLEEWMTDKKDDKSTWAIGGGVLAGIGVGFFFLKASALAFVGSILAGLGIGLVITAIISNKT
jgi:Na+/melibiose symporter-like transporter